jgi:ribose/xylose/arabinose/galactoside ABC-type transport system permease subunit
MKSQIIKYPDKALTLLMFAVSFGLLWISGFHFLTIPALILNSAYLFFLTLGACIILATSEIDLSVYGIVSLSTILALWTVKAIATGAEIYLLILLVILFATIFSLINAFAIVRFKLNSLLVTLATFSIYFGLAMFIYVTTVQHDKDRYAIPDEIRALAEANYLGVKPAFFILVLCLITLWLIINKTKLGLAIKAIGQSAESARFSNVNIPKTMYISFALAGTLYGVGCVFSFVRFASTRPSELIGDAVVPIMCAVISGASIRGGRLPLLFAVIGTSTFLCIQQLVMHVASGVGHYAAFGLALFIYIFVRYSFNSTN